MGNTGKGAREIGARREWIKGSIGTRFRGEKGGLRD